MKETEKLLERKLSKSIKKAGGLSLKLVTVFAGGLPDRICLFPKGQICFVEVKTTGQKPRKIQVYWHNKLRSLGFEVFVIDTTEGIKKLLKNYE